VYTWSTAALKEYRERKREVAQLQHQLATLKKENERLKKQRNALFTDEEIEKLARERFGLVKPGEKAYVVIMNDREENDGR
jgi:cell division protein FtsB